ncbi:hypothetical protein B0F90DRAFT_1672137 [Multifurca ochricompacta]|uniref:Uncharacterized protein n=1 Tax=Multifurca ochricompacta TaxID=376703 RepID=A0AAD4LTN6_9AGAM|nr:hypothetical protein B0F90DRAFT_1672137 [Multifurca ochricompacta]
MTLPSAMNPTLQHTIPTVKEVLLHCGMKTLYKQLSAYLGAWVQDHLMIESVMPTGLDCKMCRGTGATKADVELFRLVQTMHWLCNFFAGVTIAPEIIITDLAHLHVGPGNEGLLSPDCLIKICSSLPDLHPSGGPLQLSGTPSLIFMCLTIGMGNGSGSKHLIPPQMITQNDLTTRHTPSPSTVPLMTQTIHCGPLQLTGPRLASLPSPNTPPLQQCA